MWLQVIYLMLWLMLLTLSMVMKCLLICDLATFSSQPYYVYDDRCANLETQYGDAVDTMSCDAVADTGTYEVAETHIAIGDISTFAVNHTIRIIHHVKVAAQETLECAVKILLLTRRLTHSLPWIIDDTWCTWGSQILDDEQTNRVGPELQAILVVHVPKPIAFVMGKKMQQQYEPTFLQGPTFQQTKRWNVNDDSSTWGSQMPGDEQTIPVIPEPQATPTS